MALYLMNNEGNFLKDIDSANGTIEFTKKQDEAKIYSGGTWFADTELEYVRFHFKDNEEVKTLKLAYLDT